VLADQIHIRSGFSRSVNLARDQDAPDLLDGYVPTSRALATLEQIADGLTPDARNRAIALIGPYGAGKSAFGLFAGALLSAPGSEPQRRAMARLALDDANLARRIQAQLGSGRGLLRVSVNGTPDSLVRQLLTALAAAVTAADLPKTLGNRISAAARPGTRLDHVAELFTQARTAWAEAGGSGLLIELDELGKPLEYAAHHPQHNEIHLLQLLGEAAAEPGPAPLHILVMLHQAFEHYGQRLGKGMRDEWKKVQGRFAAVAFLEPAEQALRVVAAAMTRDGDLPETIDAELFDTTAALAEGGVLPHGMDLARAI
jgi:hypothetical protein